MRDMLSKGHLKTFKIQYISMENFDFILSPVSLVFVVPQKNTPQIQTNQNEHEELLSVKLKLICRPYSAHWTI